MSIETYNITTCMGSANDVLPFLSSDEMSNFNSIGYSGKDTNNNKISRVDYLNSLNKGEFKIDQIKTDNGDFTEKFIITRVQNGSSIFTTDSNIIEGLLIWTSEFCGSKGYIKTDNGMETMWYLKEDAAKLYGGVDDKNLKLYTTKEIMLKYSAIYG